jgi:hypothetical protein
MSRGTPDTGDNNPVAAGRIARTVLLMLLAVVALWVMGRMVGVGPSLKELSDFIKSLASFPGGGDNRGGGGGGGAGEGGGGGVVRGGPPAKAKIKQAFVGDRGLVTAAQAQEVVNTIIRMQETIERLPEAERAQARAERDKLASELFKARLKAYLTASPAKKRAELDRQIRQDQLMRRAWNASRKSCAAAGEGFPGGGGGWPGEGGGGGTEDEQNRHLKNFLDNTSPEQRARYEEYRRAMEARRQQMRLPP